MVRPESRCRSTWGFGDAITPVAETIVLPTLLDQMPPPVLRAYPKETVVAEKTHAMVLLGMGNTRMKDFYDVAYLSRHFDFEGPLLVAALKATFKRRGTALPLDVPLALSSEFADDPIKRTQWLAFVGKSGLNASSGMPEGLSAVIQVLRVFLLAPLASAALDEIFHRRWSASGPWVD